MKTIPTAVQLRLSPWLSLYALGSDSGGPIVGGLVETFLAARDGHSRNRTPGPLTLARLLLFHRRKDG